MRQQGWQQGQLQDGDWWRAQILASGANSTQGRQFCSWRGEVPREGLVTKECRGHFHGVWDADATLEQSLRLPRTPLLAPGPQLSHP